MSVTQRRGVITCIPKEDKPKKYLKNWRPITLLNTAYKIASACIANRLKIVLPKIIHKDQTGFLKGRYIGENIRLLYDTLVYTEKEEIPGLLLLIDFEKAFDSISWSFMQKCLNFFNFGPNVKRWIRTFYKKYQHLCLCKRTLHEVVWCIQRGQTGRSLFTIFVSYLR
ncbi:RNA-directed DNA polymerase [Thiolapillus sp.]|uniref:RNA-directed DNA polymerase n=1 Tax=Thiolapillus sp. TaxID=2017437 RepID=UPI003AF71767